MNNFDLAILSFCNQFAQKSWTFDTSMLLIAETFIFKGGLIMALFWWGWFRKTELQKTHRGYILSTLVAGLLSLALARVLANALPFLPRPINNPELNFVAPHGLGQDLLSKWSAFPSDHATLFFCLATGLLYISRSVGAFAFIYVTLIICLPRIYLGLHYPSDIIAGAAIGVAMVCLINMNAVRLKISPPLLSFKEKHCGLFYACFFMASYQFCTNFADVRKVGNFCGDVLKAVWGLA